LLPLLSSHLSSLVAAATGGIDDQSPGRRGIHPTSRHTGQQVVFAFVGVEIPRDAGGMVANIAVLSHLF